MKHEKTARQNKNNEARKQHGDMDQEQRFQQHQKKARQKNITVLYKT